MRRSLRGWFYLGLVFLFGQLRQPCAETFHHTARFKKRTTYLDIPGKRLMTFTSSAVDVPILQFHKAET